ncbi:hypothetical protein U9M48_043013 [Paspalum notatum var. saurae]|uniref:Integrase catalytic domain-containing protein n=1 Tax=Paspalum notatum var. saurae TaxID=547442 RepID=A0AAQ3XGT7_PASNO
MMSRVGMVRRLPQIEHINESSVIAAAGKQKKSPFAKKAKYRASDRLELVHGDPCRPISLATHGRRKYFLLLVDDNTRFMWLHLLSCKDKAAEAIKHFQVKVKVEAETGNKLKVLRTDRGGELTSVEFRWYCTNEGMGRHLTMSYSPQQNGVVERRNQTIEGMAWGMPKAKVLAEFWKRQKPDVEFLLTFGCIGHVKNVKPHLGKLEGRSTPMVLLGYEEGSKAYRMYDPQAEPACKGRGVRRERKLELGGNRRRGGWAVRNLDGELYMASTEKPRSLEEAEDDARWWYAMEEMASIEDNKTWEFVDPPVGCKPIGLKWVYNVKKNERGDVVKHKARLVAKCLVQREGIDFEEVFAPVARMDLVRLLLALAATRD